MNTIIDRITANPPTMIAVVLGALVLAYYMMRVALSIIDGGGKALSDVLLFCRAIYRELAGGEGVEAYERLNGFLMLGLFVMGLAAVILLAIPSIHGIVVGGGQLSSVLVATFLVCVFLFISAGLACVHVCKRHHDDVSAAKRLSSRGEAP